MWEGVGRGEGRCGRGEKESVGGSRGSVLGCGEVRGKVENVGRGVGAWQRCGEVRRGGRSG